MYLLYIPVKSVFDVLRTRQEQDRKVMLQLQADNFQNVQRFLSEAGKESALKIHTLRSREKHKE